MHADAFQFVKQIADTKVIREPIIEIGSRNINGSARDAFSGCKYVGFDIAGGNGVDVIIDITKTKSKAHLGKYRTIITTETLEHVLPASIVPAMFDYVSGDCQVIITCATGKREPHSAVDGGHLRGGEYYGNVDPSELKALIMANNGNFECVVYYEKFNDTNSDLYVYAELIPKVTS